VALFITALIIWFVIRVVGVLLLVFIAVLLAVYLSAVTDQLERRLRLARGLGLAVAVIVTLALVSGIWILFVPPVVVQTTALIAGLPRRWRHSDRPRPRGERYHVSEPGSPIPIGPRGGHHRRRDRVAAGACPYITRRQMIDAWRRRLRCISRNGPPRIVTGS
jgi:hypothetical protein